MKRALIRKIAGGLSLTTAMFIFQACYGTPQDFGLDLLVEGQVKASNSGLPVKGIKVSVADHLQYELTDEEGRFSFYTELANELMIQFKDVDSEQNGFFFDRDTVITGLSDKVFLEIILEER